MPFPLASVDTGLGGRCQLAHPGRLYNIPSSKHTEKLIFLVFGLHPTWLGRDASSCVLGTCSLSITPGPSSACAQDCLGCPRPHSHHAAPGRSIYHAGRVDHSQTSASNSEQSLGSTLDTTIWMSPRPTHTPCHRWKPPPFLHWLLLFSRSQPLVALASHSLALKPGSPP